MSEMKKDIREQDVIRLMEQWKGKDVAYPSGLQEKRREAFLALGISALSHGVETGKIVGEIATQSAQAAATPMTLGTQIVLGVLSTVIIGLSTYLGVNIYRNRDALRDFFGGGSPTAVLVSPSPHDLNGGLATPTFLSTGTPVFTPTPISTLVSPEPGEQSQPATPTKPGLHLGQTKTPKPKPK